MDVRRRSLIGHRSMSSADMIDINAYVTFIALEDGLTISLSSNACEYCIDGDGK